MAALKKSATIHFGHLRSDGDGVGRFSKQRWREREGPGQVWRLGGSLHAIPLCRAVYHHVSLVASLLLILHFACLHTVRKQYQLGIEKWKRGAGSKKTTRIPRFRCFESGEVGHLFCWVLVSGTPREPIGSIQRPLSLFPPLLLVAKSKKQTPAFCGSPRHTRVQKGPHDVEREPQTLMCSLQDGKEKV